MNKGKQKSQEATVNTFPSFPLEADKNGYEGLNFDRMFHAALSHFAWMSPKTLILSFVDWLTFLIFSPGKQYDLDKDVIAKIGKILLYFQLQCTDKSCEHCISTRQTDHRFQSELWNDPPFNFYSQSFLLMERWWDNATTNLRGVNKHHQQIVNFTIRQILDVFSPSNVPAMNPEVLFASINEGGMNFVNGWRNCLEDTLQSISGKPPVGSETFKVGENVAITPGKVIYKNRLIELIQYEPKTAKVYAEPVLILRQVNH
ncbi:MAG: poly-beta-hydroxybutyrate polymerase N-terminal domain-containing protein [Legionella sp.]